MSAGGRAYHPLQSSTPLGGSTTSMTSAGSSIKPLNVSQHSARSARAARLKEGSSADASFKTADSSLKTASNTSAAGPMTKYGPYHNLSGMKQFLSKKGFVEKSKYFLKRAAWETAKGAPAAIFFAGLTGGINAAISRARQPASQPILTGVVGGQQLVSNQKIPIKSSTEFSVRGKPSGKAAKANTINTDQGRFATSTYWAEPI